MAHSSSMSVKLESFAFGYYKGNFIRTCWLSTFSSFPILFSQVHFLSSSLNQFGTGFITPLPKDKITDWSKLKAFADNKFQLSKNY